MILTASTTLTTASKTTKTRSTSPLTGVIGATILVEPKPSPSIPGVPILATTSVGALSVAVSAAPRASDPKAKGRAAKAKQKKKTDNSATTVSLTTAQRQNVRSKRKPYRTSIRNI